MLKEETVARALHEIAKGDAEYVYFFEHNNSAAWLEPLSRHGRFQEPPSPIRAGQYIRFPPWPESRYLARMSALPDAGSTVLEIALRIPATDNVCVHDDLVEIALNLQPQQSARLVSKVCEWIQSPVKRLLPHKIGDLIAWLAGGGEAESALTLARAALSLGPDLRPAGQFDEESLDWPEPRPRFATFYYERIVDRALPTLVVASGLAAFRLVCEVLDEYISLSRKRSDEGDEDYLYNRQAGIEEPKDPHDLGSTILCAVRDAAEQLIRVNRSQFRSVVEILRTKRWVSFRRLELHLCRVFPEDSLWIADEFFRSPRDVDRLALRHEAVLLLKSTFPLLSGQTQQCVLTWIDEGPPEDTVRAWLGNFPQPVTDEGVRAISDEWRRDHLAVLRGQLPQQYECKLSALVLQLGEGRPLEGPWMRSTGGPFSPQSPKSVKELDEMHVRDILSLLAAWAPGNDIFAPTAEGLGQSLTAAVASRPSEFAALAESFRHVDPTYVRCFLAGLTEALKQSKLFDWQPVLDLATWVTAQPREIPGRKGGLMVADPDWGWTRTAIIDLIMSGFADGPGGLASSDRDLVWQALKPLTEDPFPSVEDEAGPHFDPAFLSINSTRGRALYAVVRYAWWVSGCKRTQELSPLTFANMPEVRDVLEAHLDPRMDPTLTVRAVYGESIASFARLDWEWLQSNLDRILPDEGEEDQRFTAAWESFVTSTPPYLMLFPLLEPSYRRAVDRIGKPAIGQHPISPESRLAEHLMVYFWWGKLEFGSDGLIDRFYAVAPAELCAHALWSVRASFGIEDAPPRLFERLQELMKRRLAAAGQAPSPEDFVRELV